ncbi:MAG: ferritin family protein [Candidatus Riflebacteria bacterium]|nr:ferritin family protein [Candidatus Riflebacteria bacterium]
MKTFGTVAEVLDFAISREEEAIRFYRELATKADKGWIKELLESFAREEEGHRAKLQALKEGKGFLKPGQKVTDLAIADYIVEAPAGGELSYQDALVLAMKREKAAFKLYSDLARSAAEPALRDALLAMAQEEAKHKLRFELEYDEQVLKEN